MPRFTDPDDLACFTTRHVLDGEHPIRLVTHDEDDGGWQFLPGIDVVEADARIVGLGNVVKLDPTLLEVADLPLGGRAWRDGPGAPWTRGHDGAE